MLRVFSNLFTAVAMVIVVSNGALAEDTSSAKSNERVLRLVGPPWEPFLYEDNPNKGLATEIVVEALKRAGYESSVGIRPWRRVLAEASAGVADVLIGLWYNSDRAKRYNYSDSYYKNQISFVGLRGKVSAYQSLTDLKGFRIGVRKGASFGREFDSAEYLNKISMVNSLSMLRMLSLGRVDLGIGDRLILNRILQKDEVLASKLNFIEPVYIERALHMAVSKDLPDHEKIVTDFNRELAIMKKEGLLDKIIASFD